MPLCKYYNLYVISRSLPNFAEGANEHLVIATCLYGLSSTVCGYMFRYQVCSRADYRLEIMAHSYSNPGGRCADFGGKCCDNGRETWCTKPVRPDPFFIFCLGQIGRTGSNLSQCPLGRKVSNTESNGTNFFTFAAGSSASFGLPIPLPFTVTGSLLVR